MMVDIVMVSCSFCELGRRNAGTGVIGTLARNWGYRADRSRPVTKTHAFVRKQVCFAL